jgi:hypothetical protein
MSLHPVKHDCIEMIKDINPVIKKGMIGVILMKFNDVDFEVEFVKADGTNYEYEGNFTFTISASEFKLVPTPK